MHYHYHILLAQTPAAGGPVINNFAVHRYKHDQALKADATAAAIGEEVHTFVDISTSGGKNLSWTGTGLPPVRSNGFVSIGSATDIEWLNNTVTPIAQPYEYWLVMQNETGNDSFVYIQSTGFKIQGATSNLRIDCGLQVDFSGANPPNGVTKILRIVVNGASSGLYTNNVAHVSNPQNLGADSLSNFKIGNPGGGAIWSFKEVFITGALSSADANDVYNELATEYL
jgi:hypothetical protein